MDIPAGAHLTAYRFDKLPETLELYMHESGFTSNPVTVRMTRAIRLEDIAGKSVLDDGAGAGSLGIWAKKLGATRVDLVEPSSINIALARANLAYHGLEDSVGLHQGGWFEPVPGMRYDTIIGDVAGIADGPAHALWYSDEVPAGGPDGTDIIIPLIHQSPGHLNPGGALYFPVTFDLAASELTMIAAKHTFKNVECVEENITFYFSTDERDRVLAAYQGNLPSFLRIHEMERKRPGREYFWTGQIYRASEPFETIK